jgi:NDP-hexose 5-epimerase
MTITEMAIPDAYRLVSEPIPDNRGCFYEAWRLSEVSAALGRPFRAAQVNFSVSRRNTLRGIHGIAIPPGQVKLVTCVRGRVLDVVVDLRIGSPAFGKWETTVQDQDSGLAVLLSEGLGHAFLALTDDACMNYVCSSEYVAGTMIDINAQDPMLGIPWNLTGPPIMSEKDAAAPGVEQAAEMGLLPTYEECLAVYAATRPGGEAGRREPHILRGH